jgi:SAM-dependent methyltransferase
VALGGGECYEAAMSPFEATGPNAEQITFWNEGAAPKWIRYQRELDEQLRSLGKRAMDRADVRAGDRVLDVGCGCGGTTIDLASRVGPQGEVVGIDISSPMLEHAESRARQAKIANLQFRNADAQSYDFAAPDFDVLYSRFGVMFFADPSRAFANLRRALRPGGRLAFVCWQPLDRNPWMAVPMAAAAREIAFPPPAGPEAPGPFSFGDPQRVRRILGEAGFADVTVDGHEETLTPGGTASLDEAVDFLVQMGPTGAALRQDPAATPRVKAAVEAALKPFHTDVGVRMASAAWIVGAISRPDATR